MCQMVHKICGTVLAESVDPDFVASEGMLLRSADWRKPDGSKFRQNAPILCPKCKKQISVHHLEFTSDQ